MPIIKARLKFDKKGRLARAMDAKIISIPNNLVGFDKSPTNPAEIAPKGRIQSLATVMDPTVTAP